MVDGADKTLTKMSVREWVIRVKQLGWGIIPLCPPPVNVQGLIQGGK